MKASRTEKFTHSWVIRPYLSRLAMTLLPIWAVFGLMPVTVMAQDSEVMAIEEVIVTAQRREQNLQDVPIAIQAFTADAIQKNMFRDVAQYINKTPNASFITNGARSRRQISIRGVTNFLGFVGTSTTGFYVDDFSVAGSTINPPIMDVERMEILRGPQATYFGRNALGGGISIISKKPTNDFHGTVMADYSSFNTIDLEGVINIPIVTEKLAMRINLKDRSSDGNIKNINPTGGGNDSDYQYAKASLRWLPTDNLTIDGTFQWAEEEVGMREGVPSGVFSNFAGNVLYAGEFPDRTGDGRSDPFIDDIGFFPGNRNRTNFNHPQSVGTKFSMGVLRIDYERSNLLFTSITGFIDSDFTLNGDIDGSSRDYFNEFRNLERQSVSTEFRIQNTNDSPLQWNLGFLYAEDEGIDTNRTFVGEEMSFGLPDGFLIDSEDSTSDGDTWAIFGQVDYDFSDKLTGSIGGRYSEETKAANISGFGGGFEQTLTAEDTFTDFSPRLALTYRPNDSLTWYGTISKGFKSGGVQIAPNPEAETYDPEELWNYEVGVKTDLLDQRLRLNAAVFYMDWTNLQVAFQENIINEDGDFEIWGGVNNADSATSKGAELSLTALLTEKFMVDFGVGYLNAKFDSFTALIDGENHVLDGETIPNSPKWTINADAEYDFRAGDNWDGYVRLEWFYRDDIRPNTTALIYDGFPWEVPSFNYFNLRIGMSSDNWQLVAYAENLFDNNFYTNAYQKAFASGLFIEPSYRRIGLRATYLFGK